MTTPLDNSKMLARLRVGGNEELAVIFTGLRDSIKQMVATRLDKRLHARVDASDIVQEAFVRASRALKSYLEAPNVHPVVWLRLIGKRIVAETHRLHFRDKRSPINEYSSDGNLSEILISQLAGSSESVDSNVARKELIQKTFEVLSQMPEQDREILEMRHTDEMSLKEIAELLEISIEAAKKRYQRALGRLRDLTVNL